MSRAANVLPVLSIAPGFAARGSRPSSAHDLTALTESPSLTLFDDQPNLSTHLSLNEQTAISKQIDARLAEEDKRISRERKEGKLLDVLLLGPTGAGKSTFLKQLRLTYDSRGLDAEREAVRLVIMLVICSTVRKLLGMLEDSLEREATNHDPLSDQDSLGSLRNDLQPVLALEWPLRDALGTVNSASLSLAGRLPVEEQLTYGDPEASFSLHEPLKSSGWNGLSNRRTSDQSVDSEPVVSASFVDRLGSAGFAIGPDMKAVVPSTDSRSSSETNRNRNWIRDRFYANPDDPIHVISRKRPEIEALWHNAINRGLIASEGPLEGKPGGWEMGESTKFFFASLPRIANAVWLPSDQDILNVRIRTVCDRLETKTLCARGTKHAWAPFFDHAAAIIFLFDVSAYNVCRQGNPLRNRLSDAVCLFEDIVSNPLLKNVTIITFLNKMDLLRQKIQSGRFPLHTYFPQFEGNPASVSESLRFIQKLVEKKHNKHRKKTMYIFATQANDQKSIQIVVAAVNDSKFFRI
ncbi:hypothetical protein OIV83_000799 [Microbotryomycetes sp. JL201]|nr:hypothetical protein OIV83_000799 [Microbotryomycetes sp. JL201]